MHDSYESGLYQDASELTKKNSINLVTAVKSCIYVPSCSVIVLISKFSVTIQFPFVDMHASYTLHTSLQRRHHLT
jgi:hypothetical protein